MNALSSKPFELAFALLGLQFLASFSPRVRFGERQETTTVETAPVTNTSSVIEELSRDVLVSVGKEKKPYIQLTIFSDFECPYCRDFDGSLKSLEAEASAESLRIVFRFFPKPQHAWAMPAAIAAACGAEQNQRYYFELSDYFYSHQRDLTESMVYPAATQLLSKDKLFNLRLFDRCIQGGRGQKIVDADMALGRRSGVMFTPTMFVNERPIVGNRSLPDLRELLRSASPLNR